MMARVRGERTRCDAAPGNMLSYMREKCRVKVTAASPQGGGSGSSSRVLERSDTDSSEGGGGRKSKAAQRAPTDADLRPAFKALQTAYIRLLQNPFFVPDEHAPMAVAQGKGKGGEITSPRFLREVRRIGEVWKLGGGVV